MKKGDTFKIKYLIYPILFIVLLIGLNFGYSILKTTISINGNSKINKNSWVIYFDSINIASDSTMNEDPDLDAKIINREKTNIKFTANLSNPGDFYEFTVYTVNDGTIDASVSSIEKSVLTEEQQKYLTFEVKYDDGEEIKRCDVLKANDRRLVKAVVKYKEGLDINEYPKNPISLTLFFKINYEQNTECEYVPSGKHVLTINPNGGTYKGRSVETRVYLAEGEQYTFVNPSRVLYNFDQWNVTSPSEGGTYTFNENLFTMGGEDVTVSASWLEGNYVARIEDTYYTTVADAFNAARYNWDDNTVYLLKNVTESPTNTTTKAFTFDLGGYTLTGTITNNKNGEMSLVNGTVKAGTNDEEAFVNYGTLKLGEEGLPMLTENSIKLIGNSVGLRNVKTGDNKGKFYFYDGYVEGTVGIVGGYTDKEDKYYVFAEHVSEKNTQRVYLIRNPNRAVAKTETDGEIYYYNLQDAINAAEQNKILNNKTSDSDYVVTIIRSFEAAYPITIHENNRVFIDTKGHDISLGETTTVDGFLKLFNTEEGISRIRTSKVIVNNNELTLDRVMVIATTDNNAISNDGKLNMVNSTVQSKDGYGVYNKQDATINLDATSVLTSTESYGLYNESENFVLNTGNIYGFKNEGSTIINDGVKIRNANDLYAVNNNGLITMIGGEISDTKDQALIHNKGTFLANGGTISSKNVAIEGGSVTVDGGEVTSSNGPTISGYDVTVNSGEVTSTEGAAIYSDGKIVNESGRIVTYQGTVIVNGGTISGNTYAIDSNHINITGGTITSNDVAIKDNSVVYSQNTSYHIDGSTNITGGTISSTNNAVVSDNFNMTNGNISSTSATGVTTNKTGIITGGTITGNTYGVQNNGVLTIGTDEGTIVSDNPSIKGESYGLYNNGTEVNFYDGELIGLIDSHSGTITGTPTGGTIYTSEVEEDGKTYQKEYVSGYNNWLRVGDNEYNNLTDASKAIETTGTIVVTRDVDITFVQSVLDEDKNKNITLDLNGHVITSTQTIINETNLTIVDSSANQTGAINPNRTSGITNNKKLTIEAGIYHSTSNIAIINNDEMIINNADIKSNDVGILNNKTLTINNVMISDTPKAINNNDTLTINNASISATNIAINNLSASKSITINDGTISGTNYGISGDYGNIEVNGGTVRATNNNAIKTYFGTTTINDGSVISEKSESIISSSDIEVNGGYIEGTVGIKNQLYCPNKNTSYTCYYKNVTVNAGEIKGTTSYGINMSDKDNTGRLNIYGGLIEGKTDGVLTAAQTQIGKNDNTVSPNSPTIIGHTNYGLNTTAYTAFYDGILKGVTDGYNGLINIIPESYFIDEDYEFIDKREYQTDFLSEKTNWLRVGNEEFNSINKAYDAITGSEGTITVIKNAYIDFEQSIPSGKTVTLDLNGHNVIMTKPLVVNGNLTIVDDSKSGTITNINENVINNNGTLTIKNGNYIANEKNAITNSGTLTIDNGTLTSDKEYGIHNTGTLVINNGSIASVNKAGIYSTGNSTINGGTITTEHVEAINTYNSELIINGGTITSVESNGVLLTGASKFTLNEGEVIGQTNGVYSNNANNKVYINGGHIKGETSSGLYTNATTELNGGVIEGFTYGVYNYGNNTTTIGNNDGNINIDSPIMKGDSYGIYIQAGTVKFYDGIIKGITDRYYGTISVLADNAQIYDDTEVSDKKNYLTNYLIAETEVAINIDKNKKYGNLQTAINESSTNETIELLTNVPLYYELTVDNTKNLTIDLKGYTISSNKSIVNNGNLTLKNTSNTESVIKTASNINIIINNNVLNVNNITLKNSSVSQYVINNKGNATITNSNIQSLQGVYNSNIMNINNTTVEATNTAIYNEGKLDITNGTYKGDSYSVYSKSSRDATITGATLNGNLYNGGTGNTTVSTSTINGNINNSGKLEVNNTSINKSKVVNTGNLSLIESTYNNTLGSTSQSSLETAINNSSVLNINNSNIILNNQEPGKHSQIILNTGELNITNNSKLSIGMNNSSYEYRGITNQGNGNLTIEESEIDVLGGSVSHGIYSNNANAIAKLVTGNIKVKGSNTSYGVYVNTGTFEMGHFEGTGGQSAAVSIVDPEVYSEGVQRGIGVKNASGSFNFYDGIIKASKFAKPETTSNTEYQYEVTTYVDEATNYEYAILEFMGNDYSSDTVALLNGVYYKSVQAAIDKAEEGYEILLLKSVSEDLVIPTGTYVNLNLNKHSITTKLINSGTLNVYNGALQNFDKNTIVNYGTLIMGENDGIVTSSTIRIISETTTIVNEGNLIMYDGYIEGLQAVNGEINQIADAARLRVEQDVQSEKKYVQSLSEESIRNKETDLIITIDPASGLYEGSKNVKEVFKKYEETYVLKTPTKKGCNFLGWEVSEPDTISGEGTTANPYVITVGLKDITVTAKWEIDPNAVARIGDDYYFSIQEALDSSNTGDTVVLIKNTSEQVLNKKNAILDLGNFELSGKIINNGELKIINGTIRNTEGPAIDNRKNLTLGDNDGRMIEDNVKIIGSDIGLDQGGRFYFYDGFIEGDVALSGRVDSVPKGYFLYNDHDAINDCQKVYLIGNPENAVAETRVGGTQYFFSLQDAIDTASLTGYEIFIRREFEATYAINVKENANILINTNGNNFALGNEFTNNGTLKIYNPDFTESRISAAKVLNNNGTLTIDNVDIHETNTDNYAFNNTGNLTIKDSKITNSNNYTIYTTGHLSTEGDSSIISSGTYGIYNGQSDPLELNAGTISGIDNPHELILGGTVKVDTSNNQNIFGVNLRYSQAKLTMNNGEILSYKDAIYSVLDTNTLYGSTITINDGKVTSTNGTAVNIRSYTAKRNKQPDYPVYLTINDGEFTGYQYTIYSNSYNYTDINGGTYNVIQDSSSYSAIYCNGVYQCDVSNSEINARGYGIYMYAYYLEKDFEVDNVTINLAPHDSQPGIYVTSLRQSFNAQINKVKVRGLYQSSVGFSLSGETNRKFNISDVDIEVGGTGITTSTGIVNIYSGRVVGENYGINVSSNTSTVNIGDSSTEYTRDDPYISGGLYGVYNSGNGTVNFYNGRLRGSTYGYTSTLGELRKGKLVIEESETIPEAQIWNTKSTTNKSTSAVTNYAKAGNGYARITYIGETNDACTNNQKFNYDYSGSTTSFSAPCAGRYTLEVWGASANNSNYGAYSYGEIELNENETLYITVGGRGTTKTNITSPTTVAGGYNGGGSLILNSTSTIKSASSAGGATHIATREGLLSELEDYKDSVIIVASGASSSFTMGSSTYNGASGGGYVGGPKNSYFATGGTQTAPGVNLGYEDGRGTGSFGKGADSFGSIGNAGGGGWYGGGSNDYYYYSAGSGSSYIANSRIENGIMYGYSATALIATYINNFLDEKEAFLRVGNQYFNSFNDAVAAIESEGTIEVIKDAELSEGGIIPLDKNITLDINGKTLNTTKNFTNNGTFNVIDSDPSKNGKINSLIGKFIDNNGVFNFDGVNIEVKNIFVNVSKNNSETYIKNCNIKAAYMVNLSSYGYVDISNVTANVTSYGIYGTDRNIKLRMKDSTINATGSAYGISLYRGVTSYYNDIEIDNCRITSAYYCIYTYESSNTKDTFKISNTYMKSTNSNAVHLYYGTKKVEFNDCDIESTSGDAIYSDSSGSVTINGGTYKGATNGIENKRATVYVNSGTITGKQNGILNSYYLYVGDSTKELSIEDPLIIGDNYGVNNTGTFNFHNGVLKGRKNGYNGSITMVRPLHNVVDDTDLNGEDVKTTTYSTTSNATSAKSDIPKRGNGYALIKYLGDDNGSCRKGDFYTFDYINGEEAFSIPCTGKFSLEVWGAGTPSPNTSYISNNMAGGYSYGEIEFEENETIYINVGGEGQIINSAIGTATGGYNGGGAAIHNNKNSSAYSVSGGGATSIAFKSGQLSTLVNNKDKIIIVAGGAGGSAYYNSSYYGSGGAGGGFKAANGTSRSQYYGTGATQSAPGYNTFDETKGKGSFGQGGSSDTANADRVYGGGGGGGYYGGAAGVADDTTGNYPKNDLAGGGGGSGYTGHTRLFNTKMVGYNVESNIWIKNYLSSSGDGFLEVDGQIYDNFDDAIEAIDAEGTIKVLGSSSVTSSITIPAGKNITIDLNNKKIDMNSPFVNNSNLIITDSSTTKGGQIYNSKENGIVNNKNLVLEYVDVISKGSCSSCSGIQVTTANANIEIRNDAYVEGYYYGIYGNKKYSVTVNDSQVKGNNYDGILISIAGSEINLNNSQIRGSYNSVNLSSAGNLTLISNNSLLFSTGNVISTYQYKSIPNTIKIYNSEIASNSNGIAIRAQSDNLEIKNSVFNYYGDSETLYAIDCDQYSTCIISDNTVINYNNSSAIKSSGNLIISDTTINTRFKGIDINKGSLTLDNVTINTTDVSNGYGIYADTYEANLVLNNTNINSKNVGIYLGHTNNNRKTLQFNSGSIIGETYGIYQDYDDSLVVIGNEQDSVSITNPYVEGGLYSIYKTSGTLDFYSGRMKGYIKGNPESFNIIRSGYEVYETTDEVQTYLQKKKNINVDNVSEQPIANTSKQGNGYAKVTYMENVIGIDPQDVIYDTDCDSIIGREYHYLPTKSQQSFTAKCTGKYKLEVWGGSGSDIRYNSSKGGYAAGNIQLETGDNLLVYVGTSGANGGYNGGGYGTNYTGGGATDIRLTDSLYSRIIVAGGAGGTGSWYYGGAGGGTSGGNGYGYWSSDGGKGATQTAGWAFGLGSSQASGAGGGGWYGGYSPSDGTSGAGGGGGSGYVATATSTKPSGYLVPEKYYLTDTKLIAGSSSMPSHDGKYNLTGNSGDGYAKITYIGKSANAKQFEVRLITSVGELENSVLEYDRGDALGDIPTPTADSDYIFKGWYIDPEFKEKVTSETIVNNSMSLYAKFAMNSSKCDSYVNKEYLFDYTGNIQSLDIMCPGKYKLEVWGAQGGSTTFGENSNTGGYGAYSSGEVIFDKNQKLYIGVGGEGQSATVTIPDGCTATSCRSITYSSSTGYNGGGKAAGTYNNSTQKNNGVYAGGGGATHIAYENRTLRYLSGTTDTVLIVAGGGGGSSTNELYPDYSGDGGHAGGLNAGAGQPLTSTCETYGTGATYKKPGLYKKCVNATTNSINNGQMYAAYGMGSNKTNNSNNYYAGGGGGYFGGGSGYYGPAGGGTGYIGSSLLSNKAMYAYDSEDSFVEDYSNVIYLIESRETIKNVQLDKTYRDIQEAFNEARTGDTIELLDDTVITTESTVYDDLTLTLDLKDYSLKSYKSITNNGILNIVGNNNSKLISKSYNPIIINNGVLEINDMKISGNTAIKNNNNGDLTLDNMNIDVYNIAIENNGKMTVEDSTINGDVYGIYSNASSPEEITNSTLNSKQTAYYKYSTVKTTFENSNINGQLNNAKTNAQIVINGGTITNYINNSGNTSIDSASINFISTSLNDDTYVINSGLLTITNSTISHVNKTSINDKNVGVTTINNSGTLTSRLNVYTLNHDNNTIRNKKFSILDNSGILSSTNDSYTVTGGDKSYVISNSSSNTSNVINPTIKVFNSINGYGLYSTDGSIKFTGGTIEAYNSDVSGGVYSVGGNPIFSDTNISVHDSTSSSYGVYTENGKVTIETGNVRVSGPTAYGAFITNGTLELGIEDGSGTDGADVSITNPYIEAIGTSLGIGVSTGNGSFNYYDGYITGSTSPRAEGDITTATDKNYEVVTYNDPETGYDYCILEFIK